MFRRKYILEGRKVKAYNEQRNMCNKELPICLAAHKSMRFMPEGNITVCCHNNTFVLGKYPEISPMQAWNSDNLGFIKKKLAKADFTAGCQTCFYAFDKLAFDSVNPLLYENYNINTSYPVVLDFKIATECNLECIMCSEYSSSAIRNKSNNYEDRFIYNDSFIDSLSEIIPHLKEARFSGGEPFMNAIYFKIWDLLIEKNPSCKIYIQTNGTILNTKIKSLLERGNFFINVSVDALDPDLYSKIRINAVVEKTIANIEYFADYSAKNSRKFGITACAMKDNISEWANLVVFANKYNATIWFSEVYFPFVNAMWLMTGDEIRSSLDRLKYVKLVSEKSSDEYNIKLFNDLILKLNHYYLLTLTEHKRGYYISSKKLRDKLHQLCETSINDNPEVWSNVEKVLMELKEFKLVDFTDLLIDEYNSDFVYNHLGKLSYSQLKSNFEMLIKGR